MVSLVVDGFCGGEAEPWSRIAESERPYAQYDLLSPFYSADTLRFHRMTDGDVALHSERCQTQRRSVDPYTMDSRNM